MGGSEGVSQGEQKNRPPLAQSEFFFYAPVKCSEEQNSSSSNRWQLQVICKGHFVPKKMHNTYKQLRFPSNLQGYSLTHSYFLEEIFFLGLGILHIHMYMCVDEMMNILLIQFQDSLGPETFNHFITLNKGVQLLKAFICFTSNLINPMNGSQQQSYIYAIYMYIYISANKKKNLCMFYFLIQLL